MYSTNKLLGLFILLFWSIVEIYCQGNIGGTYDLGQGRNVLRDSGIADEVKNLPGLDFKINYKHYSGYLNSTDNRFLHYWFFESQRNPQNDPVVLWMNGGPGCSSLLGLLTEQGPLHVNSNGRDLYSNPNSWNLENNIIFLEAPAGVGFSYKLDKNYATNDDEVAKANYAALQSFFKKFPQFKNNDFYVTGESYGGIYVPTLSVEILRGAADINFKGFAVGNGYLDQNFLGNSLIYFGYFHGLYDTKVWNDLVNICCNKKEDLKYCDFVNNQNSSCNTAVETASSFIHEPGLNVYNLYSDCKGQTTINQNISLKHSREYFDRKLMIKTLNLKNEKDLIQIIRDTPPCVDTSYVEKWINQKSVRKALHIPDFVDDWSACSLTVEMGYTNLYKTMTPQVKELLSSSKNLKGLIYNGDVDMACNFLGDEWFVESLGLELISDYNIWHYNKQIAGYYKVYDRLGFVTVRGSGHMVPTDRAGAALLMFQTFVNSEANPMKF